jgi:hypothetical protein
VLWTDDRNVKLRLTISSIYIIKVFIAEHTSDNKRINWYKNTQEK